MPISWSKKEFAMFPMNGIDTRIAIGGVAAGVGARSPSESHPEKPPAKNASVKPDPEKNRIESVRTDRSFSTYGVRNERVAVVVKNGETGEVIHEIPSEEMQKLHVHLDMLV
jgi:hypothetical protein